MSEFGVVRRTVVLPVPPEAVWRALTDSEQLSAWLGGDVEIDAVPGGQIALREDGRLRRGVVVDMDPLRHLEIRWLPLSRRVGFLWGPDEEPAGTAGAVEFTLEAVPDRRSRLTVVEHPPVSAPARPSALAVA
jgi:uncharacterized protein YndB with AHSA1/START domain